MSTVERIMKLLNEANISGTQLEKELGLSTGVVSAWNRGKYFPSTDAIVKIANYFHVTTDYLLGLDEFPFDVFILEDDALSNSKEKDRVKKTRLASSYTKSYLSNMDITDSVEQDRIIKLLDEYSNSSDEDRSKMLDLIEFAIQYIHSH